MQSKEFDKLMEGDKSAKIAHFSKEQAEEAAQDPEKAKTLTIANERIISTALFNKIQRFVDAQRARGIKLERVKRLVQKKFQITLT